MKCNYLQIGEHNPETGLAWFACPVCWHWRQSEKESHSLKRVCGPPGTTLSTQKLNPPEKPCFHLGAEVRRQKCPTCKGNVIIKVLGCSVLKECTVAKQLPGTACCSICPHYSTS